MGQSFISGGGGNDHRQRQRRLRIIPGRLPERVRGIGELAGGELRFTVPARVLIGDPCRLRPGQVIGIREQILGFVVFALLELRLRFQQDGHRRIGGLGIPFCKLIKIPFRADPHLILGIRQRGGIGPVLARSGRKRSGAREKQRDRIKSQRGKNAMPRI